MPEKKQVVDIQGKKVKLSNLNKVLFPDAKIIKAEIIKYYLGISEYMLKFGSGRPLSLIRYPDGILAHQFYSKNAPDWRPDWMETFKMDGDDNDYIILRAQADLVWLANLAALEIHAMNKVLDKKLMMDHIVFDFDPPETFSYEELRDLTCEIGRFLDDMGFVTYVKTSGSRGAHIYIPIIPADDFDKVIKQIKLLAKAITQKFPEQTTSFFRKDKRKGKILVDINRNFEAQTTILPFSTRARKGAPVSMPLFWEDFGKTKSSQDYTIKTCFDYLKKKGYAWEAFYDNAVDILTMTFGGSPILKNVIPAEKVKSKTDFPEWFRKANYKHMLADVSKELLISDQLVYENKWDGIRVFVYIIPGNCKIISRSGREITHLFPRIAETGIKANVTAIIDGELIVADEKGRPDFSKIISRMHSKTNIDRQAKSKPALLYAFDILRTKEGECIDEKWSNRRNLLKGVLKKLPKYKLSTAVAEGQLLYDAAEKLGLEGIMIKDINATYTLGKRTKAWKKLKFRSEATCVILGYTDGEGDRKSFFGSLHIAEIVESELVYRGRVGTGFDQELLAFLMEIFVKIPKGTKFIEAKTDEESRTTWFDNPLPICEIRYARMTGNETFREPVFIKLTETFYDRNS